LAAAQAFAHGLDHFLARLVAGLAADADAVGGHLAGAVAASEITLTNADAIPTTANRAEAAGQRAAEILHRLAGDLIVATAVDLAAISALLNANFALWHNAAGVAELRLAGCGGRIALDVGRANRERTVFQQSSSH
jgi:hypothetical protein